MYPTVSDRCFFPNHFKLNLKFTSPHVFKFRYVIESICIRMDRNQHKPSGSSIMEFYPLNCFVWYWQWLITNKVFSQKYGHPFYFNNISALLHHSLLHNLISGLIWIFRETKFRLNILTLNQLINWLTIWFIIN